MTMSTKMIEASVTKVLELVKEDCHSQLNDERWGLTPELKEELVRIVDELIVHNHSVLVDEVEYKLTLEIRTFSKELFTSKFGTSGVLNQEHHNNVWSQCKAAAAGILKTEESIDLYLRPFTKSITQEFTKCIQTTVP